MHHSEIFTELAVLFALAFGASALMKMLRVPTIVGFLLAGMVAGPSALNLLSHGEAVQTLAEIGVMLLLFTIGLELSPAHLWRLRREALIGGGLQVGGSTLIAALGAMLLGLQVGPAIGIGFFVALSSTAVVLRLLAERGESDSPHGRIALAILLFQDVIAVPMTLVLPLLASGQAPDGATLLALLRAVLLVALILIVARRVVPLLFDRAPVLRSREGFLLGVATIVTLTALATLKAGLSPALGAFLAGMIISETEHRHLVLAETIPFRELFLAVFFVSVGLLLDLPALAANPLLPLLLAVGFYGGKTILIAGVAALLGHARPVPWRTGLYLGQVGEFSFVVLLAAGRAGLLSEAQMQPLLAAAALTLLATPFLARLRSGVEGVEVDAGEEQVRQTGHAVIVGFGPGGQAVCKVMRALGLPYRVVDLNPDSVRRHRDEGEPILLGDASRPEVLDELAIEQARVAVIMINDPAAVRPILMRMRARAPELHIILRTRYASDLAELHKLGADVVLPEELEVALSLVGQVMTHLGIAADVQRRHLAALRAEGYALAPAPLPSAELAAPTELLLHPVEPGDSAIGHALIEAELASPGVQVIAVLRDGEILLDPLHTPLAAEDHLVLSGAASDLAATRQRLLEGAASGPA